MANRKGENYIDKQGNPRGDWRRIIGDNLARWNEEQERKTDNRKD